MVLELQVVPWEPPQSLQRALKTLKRLLRSTCPRHRRSHHICLLHLLRPQKSVTLFIRSDACYAPLLSSFNSSVPLTIFRLIRDWLPHIAHYVSLGNLLSRLLSLRKHARQSISSRLVCRCFLGYGMPDHHRTKHCLGRADFKRACVRSSQTPS